jgi:putative transposase
MSDQTACHKTYTYTLTPTPAQERELERVVMVCRHLDTVALEQRSTACSTAWQRCHVSVSRYQQEAQLKDIRAAFPEYAAVHSHVLQDVLARLDKTYQAFFRRVQRGEKAGFSRCKGRDRFHSFTYKAVGTGARLDNGVLVLATIGRIAVRWSRLLEGEATPKTVTVCREAEGWYVGLSCAEVPIKLLPLTGRETGIDLGLESFATRANGEPIETRAALGWQSATSGAPSGASRVARKAAAADVRRSTCSRERISGCGRKRADFHHKTALGLVRAYDTISHEDLQTARRPDGQHAPEPPPREVHRRRRVEGVPAHPVVHSGRSWQDRRSRAACVHLARLFGLRRARVQGLVHPLAPVPGVWDESAARSYCCAQHLARRKTPTWARAEPSGAHVGRWAERRLSIRGDVSPAECQRALSGWRGQHRKR